MPSATRQTGSGLPTLMRDFGAGKTLNGPCLRQAGPGAPSDPNVLFVSLWRQNLTLKAKNLPKFKKFPGIQLNSGVLRRNIW
jgi:hypothetical protein